MKALAGFAGIGGPEIALREAGFETIGIEIDPAIAEINRYNGGNVITADILGIDPLLFLGYILFHFSPPCPPYSVARNSKAKQNLRERISDLARHQSLVNGEGELDIRFARKMIDFIKVVKPKYFTLENVWGYRESASWQMIWYTLQEEGYGVDAWNLNAADYGAPQTRRRMIVIARRDGRKPAKPFQTHAKKPDMFTSKWVGWFETIEDLIPDLPESQFAPWQFDRSPDELKTFLMMTGNTNRNGNDNKPGRGYLGKDQPANTVNTVGSGSMPRAILIPGDNTSNGVIRKADEPIHAGVAGHVVSMTVRCLARFQGFPDSFILPGEPGLAKNPVLISGPLSDGELACRGIGNASPPGFHRAALKSLGFGGGE